MATYALIGIDFLAILAILGPIGSPKPLKMWLETKCWHPFQQISFASFFCKPSVAIYDLIGADLLWSRLHGIIRMHTYVTESEVTDCYAAYRSCDGFCKPSVARSHSVAADFLLDGPHGIIHPSEDVTEHLVPAFHSTTFGCISFCCLWRPDPFWLRTLVHRLACIQIIQTHNHVIQINIGFTFYSTYCTCINLS